MIALVGVRPVGVLKNATHGTSVRKVGASSEVTLGEIDALHVSVDIPYETDQGQQTATFQNIVGMSALGSEGDSGALVLAGDQAVGIHFAGSASASFAIPMQTVLDRFDVTLA
jgi:hypothetical protein